MTAIESIDPAIRLLIGFTSRVTVMNASGISATAATASAIPPKIVRLGARATPIVVARTIAAAEEAEPAGGAGADALAGVAGRVGHLIDWLFGAEVEHGRE